MKKFAAIAILALSIVGQIFNCARAETIHFVPGPDGSTKIITPWGDFLSFDNGGSIWVGTEAEYMNNKADSVAANNGMKPVFIEGQQKNERNYVSKNGLSTSIGGNDLYEITTAILFGERPSKQLHRPPKPKDSEYVSVIWVPTKRNTINYQISTVDGKRTFTPNYCGGSGGFSVCEFTIKREFLKLPAIYVFYSKGEKPSILPVESIAKQQFKDIDQQYKTDLKGISPGEETKSDLQNLHELDASIPTSIEN